MRKREIFSFFGGDGVGTITQEGLKIPPGQPAINPVPRQMAEKAIRRIIGNKKANITVSIPGGEELAKKTFNPRLGIVNGLSILGTTGIVRPMSEEAMKDSLIAELDMYAKQGHKSILFVLGGNRRDGVKRAVRRISVHFTGKQLYWLYDRRSGRERIY